MAGSSTQGIKTVLHPVSDLATAKAVYAALLGVPGGGPQRMASPVAYWHLPDIEAKLAEAKMEKSMSAR